MVGRVVGSYRIVEKIGEGGMGAVYRAVDEMLDREVAVKAIRPELVREPEIVERFRTEARVLARIQHPAIATIYSFFQEGGEMFLAMEFVRGRPLSEVLAAERALPWRRAVPLIASALDGIEQAHRSGIIHRDLKPDNLMLTEAGTLKVMDFGIARMPGSSHLTRTGLLIGTLRYIAPEQIRGEEVDRRTDVYALGVVLYQMLTGRVPFDGPTDFAILKAQIEDPPAPPRSLAPDLPEWLDGIVLKALRKNPDDRFQTVDELRLHLSGQGSLPLESGEDLPTMVLPPRPTAAAPPVLTSPETMETDRPRLPATPAVPGTSYRPVSEAGWKRGVLAAIAVLILAAGLGFFWQRRQPAVLEPGPAAVSQPAPAQTRPTFVAAPTVRSPSPAPAPSPRETPRPASPEPYVSTRTEEKAPAPAEPVQTQEAPPSPAEPTPDPSDTAVQDLPKLAGDLAESTEKLIDVYKEFLGKKEDGGAELTEADNQLLDEIEALYDQADHFNKGINKNLFARTWSHVRKTDKQADILQRSQEFTAQMSKVEKLMGQVQPGMEVRQGWQEVRRRWGRIEAAAGGR